MSSHYEIMRRRQEMNDLSTVLFKAGAGAIKRNPTISVMYLVGLFILLVCNGLTPSLEQERQYNQALSSVKTKLPAVYELREEAAYAKVEYDRARGWFWSCNNECQVSKRKYDDLQYQLTSVERDVEASLKEGNQALGMFSTAAVDEAKSVFWRKIDSGIAYAKRRSMWDLVFLGFRSMYKDEPWTEYIMKLVIHVVTNFTLSLSVGCITFLFSVWSVIWNYSSDPVSGIIFFVCAGLGTMSFMLTYFAALYTAAATTTFVVCKAAANGLIQDRGRDGGRLR